MKKLLTTLLITGFTVSASESPADEALMPKGRDLYVGCSLLIHSNDVSDQMAPLYSARICGLAGIRAIAHYESAKATQKYAFCLPKNIEASTDPNRLMAAQYVNFFERNAEKLADVSGYDAFVLAQWAKWPCD